MEFDKKLFEANKVGDILELSYSDKDAYKNGTEIPFKTLKEVAAYNQEYLAKATEVGAAVAKEHMAKDKGVSKVQVVIPYSTSRRGKATIDVTRSVERKNPATGETTTSSDLRVIVKDPSLKVSKETIRGFKADLTAALLGK